MAYPDLGWSSSPKLIPGESKEPYVLTPFHDEQQVLRLSPIHMQLFHQFMFLAPNWIKHGEILNDMIVDPLYQVEIGVYQSINSKNL